MPTAIQAFLPVTGEAAALGMVFAGDPAAWLASPRRDGTTERWLVQLRGAALHRTVRLTVGSPWHAGTTRWRSLSWDPVGAAGDTATTDRLLPSFDGEIGLHIDGRGHATLVLDGRYQPPGGRLGTAIDTLALRRVAQATATSFVTAVATQLSASALIAGDGEAARAG